MCAFKTPSLLRLRGKEDIPRLPLLVLVALPFRTDLAVAFGAGLGWVGPLDLVQRADLVSFWCRAITIRVKGMGSAVPFGAERS